MRPCFSVVPESMHKVSRGTLKGAALAQKALQGSEAETRELLGGTEEKGLSPTRGLEGKSMIFYKTENRKNRVCGQTWSRSMTKEWKLSDAGMFFLESPSFAVSAAASPPNVLDLFSMQSSTAVS